MLPPLPRCSGWASSSLVSPNRVSLPRFHVRIGLHIVLFEVCSAFTRVAACTLARSPYVVTAIRRLQTLRLLHACSGRFRLERSPGGACTHWKSAALSRRTWFWVIPGLPRLGCPRSESGHLRTEATTPNRSQGIIAPSEPRRTFGSRARRSDRMKNCPLLQAAID